jgi:hypothetical protein
MEGEVTEEAGIFRGRNWPQVDRLRPIGTALAEAPCLAPKRPGMRSQRQHESGQPGLPERQGARQADLPRPPGWPAGRVLLAGREGGAWGARRRLGSARGLGGGRGSLKPQPTGTHAITEDRVVPRGLGHVTGVFGCHSGWRHVGV